MNWKAVHIHLSRGHLTNSFLAGNPLASIHIVKIELGGNRQHRIGEKRQAKIKATL
jgi:hypothetical protein